MGLAILVPLRELDEVAYLRFASVYRVFDSADDFKDEITVLRVERATQSGPTAQGDPHRPGWIAGSSPAPAHQSRQHSHGTPPPRQTTGDTMTTQMPLLATGSFLALECAAVLVYLCLSRTVQKQQRAGLLQFLLVMPLLVVAVLFGDPADTGGALLAALIARLAGWTGPSG